MFKTIPAILFISLATSCILLKVKAEGAVTFYSNSVCTDGSVAQGPTSTFDLNSHYTSPCTSTNINYANSIVYEIGTSCGLTVFSDAECTQFPVTFGNGQVGCYNNEKGLQSFNYQCDGGV